VESTTEQESPTVEQNQPEIKQETPEDKNWKAVREELDALKEENQKLKNGGQSPINDVRSEIDRAYLDQEETSFLQKEEIKAELKYPELEDKSLFSMAVLGEYRVALDKYNLNKSLGIKSQLPSVDMIAKRVKTEYDKSFGDVSKKSLEEGAKKAQQSVAQKEATVDIESRSDRSKDLTSNDELKSLKRKSQEGDISAVAERLKRSGL
jgi:hypothetical protein